MGGFNFREMIMDPTRFRTQRSSSKNSSTSVVQLPPEILARIFEHLEGRDLASVARVCKTFHQASLVEKIWQTRCQKEFKVAIASGHIRSHNSSFCKDMYSRVMRKYGHLVGEWQPEIIHYGGLVEIKYDDEKLIGVEWRATSDSKKLRRTDLFSIGLDTNNQLEILCLRGFMGPHKCHLTIKNDTVFNAKCCVPESHRHPKDTEIEYEEWSRQGAVPLNEELSYMKFLHIKKYENSFDFRRLELPYAPVANQIIQPGLFQGMYGDHGVEIIALNYEQDGVLAKVVKITGDPNVPYGKVTFRVDLRCSMVLTVDQQRSIELLLHLPRTSTNVLPQNLPMQPFVVPSGLLHMDYGLQHTLPNQCKARFSGCAQIAGYGYTNNSYTNGQWIVFNENVFAFIFLELSSISVYQRCERSFHDNPSNIVNV